MTDFRLIIVAIILSTFSIASNTLLLKKNDLKKTEEHFAIVSLVGSVLVLGLALYFGYQNRGEARGIVANRMINAAGYVRGYGGNPGY